MSAAIPDFPRIGDYLAYHARARPDAQALVLDAEPITYARLESRVDALASALLAAGVRPGDRVATLCTPSPHYLIAYLASVSIGAIWVGLNPKYARGELGYVLEDSRPRVLLTRTRIGSRDYAQDIAALVAACPSIETVVALDDHARAAGAPCLPEFLALGATFDAAHAASLAAARATVGADDPCLIVYTSGSTGRPKGAVLRHGAIARFSAQQHRLWPLSSVRVLNYLPDNHVGCVVDLSVRTLSRAARELQGAEAAADRRRAAAAADRQGGQARAARARTRSLLALRAAATASLVAAPCPHSHRR